MLNISSKVNCVLDLETWFRNRAFTVIILRGTEDLYSSESDKVDYILYSKV